MNLAQLRALLAVADEGSFTAAAGALGRTQPAVSQAVASLERELALPLVVRGRGGARMTAHGQKVLGHAREAMHRVDQIASDAAAAAAPGAVPRSATPRAVPQPAALLRLDRGDGRRKPSP